MTLFQQILLPAAGALQAQGAQLDLVSFTRKMANYMNLPDLDEVLKFLPVDPQLQQPAEQGGARVRPPGTGQYTRTSVSSEADQDSDILAQMDTGDAA